MAENDILKIEVVVRPDEGQPSMFGEGFFPSVETVDQYRANPGRRVEVARKLANNDIVVDHIGEFSISASCEEGKFEAFFGTKLVDEVMPDVRLEGYKSRAPGAESPWQLPSTDGLNSLIERAYVQRPPIYFAHERPLPPFWNDKFRLRVPVDVAQIMNAAGVHRRGLTGKGVTVAMPDSGFYHHPYFVEQHYNFLSVAAPDVVDYTSDSSGHGTGECANLFATAPGINFIGVKFGNATLGFKTAVDLGPQVITNSWGYDLDRPNTQMPNWLRPLHLAVLDAIGSGIVVCFAAGNGHFAFPGSMPEVISVGGVVVDQSLKYSATQYTSGFGSTWFPGRRTPDVSGLCGTPPMADYIVLPVQSTSVLNKQDGWGAFSGTSAASPMVAGVCALLQQAKPSLRPHEIKSLLQFTARDIVQGQNAHGNAAAPGPDGATGFGLVDAGRAIEAIL